MNEWTNKYFLSGIGTITKTKFLVFPISHSCYWLSRNTSWLYKTSLQQLILHWESVSYYTSTIIFNLYSSKTSLKTFECQGKQSQRLHPTSWIKYHLLFKGRRWGHTILFAPTLPDNRTSYLITNLITVLFINFFSFREIMRPYSETSVL